MPAAPARLSSSAVKRQAEACGFDLCGIAPAAAHPELQYLREWLDAGYAGEMHYLQRSAERRMDVTQVLPSARSVIVFGTIYNTDQPYSTEVADPKRAALARYAWGDDYHIVIQARLDRMVEWLRGEAGDTARGPQLRRYRAGPGARVRAARRARLDRQEQLPDQRGARILAVPVGDHLQSRASARRSRARSMRDLHGVPRRVSDRRAHRARRARFAALPVLPDDREQGRDSSRAAAVDRRACVRVRHLPGGLSVQSGAGRRRPMPRGRRVRVSSRPRCSISGGDRTTSCGRC